jgi:hypothetical protein
MSTSGFGGRTTLDPGGADVGDSNPFPPDGGADLDGLIPERPGGKDSQGILGAEGGRSGCVLDGIEVDCSFIRGETSVQCPANDCGPKLNRDSTYPDGTPRPPFWEFFTLS